MLNSINQNYTSIEQATNHYLNSSANRKDKFNSVPAKSFQQILDQQATSDQNGKLKFSKHANERLVSRNIDLTNAQLSRLKDGVNLAGAKGIKESLIMVDNMAFIVNTKSNTVITAVNDDSERVFTNIDGAIIM